jgi:hypothetical protein
MPGLAALLLAVKASTRHVINLGLLLMLLFFVSSSLGMEVRSDAAILFCSAAR